MAENEESGGLEGAAPNVLSDSSGNPVLDSQGEAVRTRSDMEIEYPDYEFNPEGADEKNPNPVSGDPYKDVYDKMFSDVHSEEEVAAKYNDMANTWDKALEVMDRNGDGKVDAGEMKQTDGIYKQAYQSEQNDGYITLEEFKGNLDRLQDERKITNEEMAGMLKSAEQNEFKNSDEIRIPLSPIEKASLKTPMADFDRVPDDTVLYENTREMGDAIRGLVPEITQSFRDYKEGKIGQSSPSDGQSGKGTFGFDPCKLDSILGRMKSGDLPSAGSSSANVPLGQDTYFAPSPTYQNIAQAELTR
jgi:hypothetical protein